MDIIVINLKLKLLNLDNYRLKTKGSKATLLVYNLNNENICINCGQLNHG